MLVEKSCKVCSKLHKVKQADLKRGWGKCCSKKCAAVLRERKLDRFNYKGNKSSSGVLRNVSRGSYCNPTDEDWLDESECYYGPIDQDTY